MIHPQLPAGQRQREQQITLNPSSRPYRTYASTNRRASGNPRAILQPLVLEHLEHQHQHKPHN